MQRHHLLPLQLLSRRCFGPLFDALGRRAAGFDDFRRNGLLLPCSEDAALRLRLPLHRGPHAGYTTMVMERVGQIEGDWRRARRRGDRAARRDALMRLGLVQRALRRRLLARGRLRLWLNRADPLRPVADFTDLDAMAEALWSGTAGAG